MADKYYRLVSLIVNICPLPLRELFHLCARSDPKFTATYSAHHYMLSRQSDVSAARNIRRDQYDKIYPHNGQTDVSDWDITLLATTLKLLFVKQISQMSQTILMNMDIIREVRNDLQHIASASSVSDADFEKQWKNLEDATLALAYDVKGSDYKEDIQKEIDKAKTSNMPELGNVLCEWYEEKSAILENEIHQLKTEIKQLREEHQQEMKDVKDRLSDVSENARSTKTMLYKGSRKHTNYAGTSTKRFKTVDYQQDVMQRRFSETMRHGLPSDNPISFVEMSYITQKLGEDHFIVVCGSRRSLYIKAALTVIKNMGYIENSCFELTSASDWYHVTFEEADCIVVLHPFGKIFFDKSKASAMSDIFDSMLSATKDEKYQNFRFRDIVIISDKALLDECKTYFYHKLLEGEITILDNSHILASKGLPGSRRTQGTFSKSIQKNAETPDLQGKGRALSLPSSFSETDTYDTSVTKEWKFIKEINVKSDGEAFCLIKDMCMVPPNQLATNDEQNKSLKLVNISDGKIIDRVTFSTFPRCPTMLLQDRLAVLLWQEHIIQLFSIDNSFRFNKENAIKFNGICNSIMFENGVFFALFLFPAVVKTLNMQGIELSTIALESDIQNMDINPVYTALCKEKTSFYISDWSKNLLLRVNMEGQLMAMYKDNGLNKPHAILAMSDGSVYVCNKNSHTVLQMRADFTWSRVVLGPSDNVTFPTAICYWPEENTMFVSSSDQNPMHRFKLKMFTLI